MEIRIKVSFKKGVFNPEGDTIKRTLNKLGFLEINEVKLEKIFVLNVDDKGYNQHNIDKIAYDILSNPVIEDFEIIK